MTKHHKRSKKHADERLKERKPVTDTPKSPASTPATPNLAPKPGPPGAVATHTTTTPAPAPPKAPATHAAKGSWKQTSPPAEKGKGKAAPPSVDASGVPLTAITNEDYEGDFVVTGGIVPHTYTITGLPPGLSMSAGGYVSGNPTEAGTFHAVFVVYDLNDLSTTVEGDIEVTVETPDEHAEYVAKKEAEKAKAAEAAAKAAEKEAKEAETASAAG